MVCVCGEEKIESVIERLPVMEKQKEKIDLLLEQNATEQLAGVDWDKLNTEITHRLNEAKLMTTSVLKLSSFFKIAGGIAAAAAVVFIAITVGIKGKNDLRIEKGQSAVVKFIDNKGAASVDMKKYSSQSKTVIDIEQNERKIARCNVEIIDSKADLEQKGREAAWIIIRREKPTLASNGFDKDLTSLICLF